MAELKRVIRIKLQPSNEESLVIAETMRLYTACFNAAATWGWKHSKSIQAPIHNAVYHPFRKTHPTLPSQLTCSAINRATESLASAAALTQRHRKDPTHNPQPSCPRSDQMPIRYDQRSYTINADKGWVSVAVAGGKRLKFAYQIPEGLAHYSAWQTASAELSRDRHNCWWLSVCVTKTTVDLTQEERLQKTPKVLGVDLGLTVAAMDSEGNRFGDENWRLIEERYADHRARLQAKGTKSAKRRLKATSGRQKRFRHDCDHVLSKRILSGLVAGDVVVMEDLTGIRDRVKLRQKQATRVHQWSFAQIKVFVGYKAEGKGISLALIDPKYTSQTCNQCGFKDKKNRKRQAEFKCLSCGHCANADHNAACNIRDKFLGLPVNQPLVASPRGSASRT